MLVLYKCIDWIWYIASLILWGFIASIAFEQQQEYLTTGSYGMFGSPSEWIFPGLLIWIPATAIVWLMKVVVKQYIPSPELSRLSNSKAKMGLLGIAVAITAIGIVINWVY